MVEMLPSEQFEVGWLEEHAVYFCKLQFHSEVSKPRKVAS